MKQSKITTKELYGQQTAVGPEERREQVAEMRTQLGTAPRVANKNTTIFYRGVEKIGVSLVPGSGPSNPYRAMYLMATATWTSTRGRIMDKWEHATPEARAAVVRAVLLRRALPLALEAPKWTFTVERVTRWAFDQLARARIGVVFASMGTRDNRHLDIGFRFHEATWQDEGKLKEATECALRAKTAYEYITEKGRGSWQEARTVLPISSLHSFVMSINYAALQNLCANRMKACEAEDVVAVAWLLRKELQTVAPYLAAFLRPGCDYGRSCQYHQAYSIGEAFGALFKSCNRWPGAEYTLGEEFQSNESCSDYATIAEQLGMNIPGGMQERPEDVNPLSNPIDRALFEEN